MSKMTTKMKKNVETRLNNATNKSYKTNIDRFVDWCAVNHKSDQWVYDHRIKAVGLYIKSLAKEGKSAATIHTYCSPVCLGLGIKYTDIQSTYKHKRTADDIRRSRSADANQQGNRQELQDKYARVVALQSAVGVRRAELARLTGSCLRSDDYGTYIWVSKGKGGKDQMQRILPADVPTVQRIFSGIAPDQRVFKQAEMKNKIDLHALRAQHARDCYHHYSSALASDPTYRDQLRTQLLDTFDHMHKGHDSADPRERTHYEAARRAFVADLVNDKPYDLRGANKSKALSAGVATRYDRLALMAVSVNHLSHWRLDVTAVNYMVPG